MKKLQRGLMRLERTLGSLLFGILLFIIALGILSRYFLGRPIFWIEELSIFLFIWFCFLAMSNATGRGTHIVIELFVDKLPFRVRQVVKILEGLILEFVCFILIFPCIRIMERYTLSSMMRVPEGVVFLIVPIAFLFFAFHNGLRIIGIFGDLISTSKKTTGGGNT
jgi:TRAP-type C4-dicarboxylate transport system permease small subunit